MSTNINITVGGNSLVDQAKAQQQAARQARLEKENRARLEREATQERTAALAAQGRDAAGALISRPAPRSNFQPDEPAAQAIDQRIVLTPKTLKQGTLIIPSLTTAAGQSASTNPRAIYYKEGFGNFYPVKNANGSGVLPEYPFFISNFGERSIEVAPKNGFDFIDSGFTVETKGGKKSISTSIYTLETWLYLPKPNRFAFPEERTDFRLKVLAKILNPGTGTTNYEHVLGVWVFGGGGSDRPVLRREFAALTKDEVFLTIVSDDNTGNTSSLAFDLWNHIAFAVQGQIIYFYVNGLLESVCNVATYNTTNYDLSPCVAPYNNVIIQATGSASSASLSSLWFRRIAFTPSLKYSSTPFTPVF